MVGPPVVDGTRSHPQAGGPASAPCGLSEPLLHTEGALISFGADIADQCGAGYVDRILKGEKPADLPVQAPTKYETVISRPPRHSASPFHRRCLRDTVIE